MWLLLLFWVATSASPSSAACFSSVSAFAEAFEEGPAPICLANPHNRLWAASCVCEGVPSIFFENYNITWLYPVDVAAQYFGKGAAFVLRAVGLNEEEVIVARNLNQSCLIIFEYPETGVIQQPVPSTWEGLVMILSTFSQVAANRVGGYLDQLKKHSFKEIMGSHVSNINQNFLSPVLDDIAKSWTLEKFVQSSSIDLFAVRSFLFNVFDASNLFLGNGFSFNGNYGRQMHPEFVAPKIYRKDVNYTLIRMHWE